MVAGWVGAVVVAPFGAVVLVVPGVPGAGAAELSAGGVVEAEASVEVVVVVVDASGVSDFLLQAPSARLEAARTAVVAIRVERQVKDFMWAPSELGWIALLQPRRRFPVPKM